MVAEKVGATHLHAARGLIVAAQAQWRIIVATFEPGGPGGVDGYPVVVHMFCGATREEAEGYYAAHLTTDEFFRDCTETGNFRGEFACPSPVWVERLTSSGWKPA